MKKKKSHARKKKARALAWGNPRRRKKASKKVRAPRRNHPVIGDSALALSYTGGEGKRKGKMRGPWEHVFESGDVQVIGLSDGSVKLKSKSGKSLWDIFEVEA